MGITQPALSALSDLLSTASTINSSNHIATLIFKWLSILVFYILAYTLYCSYIYPAFFSKTRHLPGPGIFELSFLERYYIVRPSDVKDMTQRQLDRIRQYGPIVRYLAVFNEERVLISDPKAIRQVLLSNSYNYRKLDRFAKMYKFILGDGLLMADGDLHKRMRKITNKTIQLGQVKGLLPSMIRPTRELIGHWKNVFGTDNFHYQTTACSVGDEAPVVGIEYPAKSPESLFGVIRSLPLKSNYNDDTQPQPKVVIDVMRAMDRVTLDIIGLAAFGVRFSDKRYEKFGLLDAYKVGVSGGTTMDRIIVQYWWGYMKLPFERLRRINAAYDTVVGFGHRHVRAKLEAITAQTRQEAATAKEEIMQSLEVKSGTKIQHQKSKDQRREVIDSEDEQLTDRDDIENEDKDKDDHVDFLSAMIKHNLESAHLEPHHRLTESELVDQALTFMSAGHETTAATVCWLLHLLSIHPEIQQKLRHEFDTHLPYEDSASVTYEAISALPYLDAVLNESMRIHPAIPAIGRVSIEDDILGDQKIYAGTTIVIHMAALQKLKTVWGEDAEEFIPERWLDKDREEQIANAKKWAFMPFISGTRVCVGQKMSILEMKVLVHAMISNFEFEPLPGFKWKKYLMLAWRPNPGMQLIVSRVQRRE